MLGVFLDRDTMGPGDLDFSPLTRTLAQWRWYPKTAPQDVGQRIDGAEVVVVNKVVLDAPCLARSEALQLVCVAATGTNNVDLEAAARLNVTVCNVRGYGTATVAQHVFALVLALSTHLFDYQQAVRRGRWQACEQFCFLDYPIRELAGKTLGIVGYGDLGRAVARIGEAFGMEVLIAARPGRQATRERYALASLLPRVDVLSLHCPLTPQTRGLIGGDELALMKRDALLINTARGGIVDELALVDALRSGRIGGAGIDVLTSEPPVSGNPLLVSDIPNLLVTPHVAWGSREARQRIVALVAQNISDFLAGHPRNVVTRAAG